MPLGPKRLAWNRDMRVYVRYEPHGLVSLHNGNLRGCFMLHVCMNARFCLVYPKY